ncbi:DUF2184 domain-containing protein [Novosphingobium sp. NDB2Meth1]|uniref:DUF2184 domain-containing protein n=1 Tax=Novosphingobium sp. NDB2Meth1 TaxID=1892847 RepID=UPI000AD5774B|nr:DUF2184 domain-containing protein [Novosphingobium sp. NDB2Meth1]
MNTLRMRESGPAIIVPQIALIAAASAPAIAAALAWGDNRKATRFLRDAFQTFDQATIDSAGAFLVGELERLDPMIHEPLVDMTWDRDIDLRTDVTMGDETSSYTTSTFASTGGPSSGGISWAGKESTTLPRINVDIEKKVNPLTLWTETVSYTITELLSAQQLGRPIDTQMLAGLNLKHQMDTDQMVYVGDPTISATGLINAALVINTGNVAAGAAGSLPWLTKTPDEITADFNELLVSVWAATGYKAPPKNVLIAPNPFGYIATTKVSEAGNISIMDYVKQNNVFTAQKNIELEIYPVKWLDKANLNGPGGAAATYDRMAAYTRYEPYVRYPMVPLQAMQPQYQGIWINVPYYGRLGRVETVYPETIGYRDGIG